MGPPPFAVAPEHPVYRRAIARELRFWSQRQGATRGLRHPSFHPGVLPYLNYVISGNAGRDWVDHVIERFRPSGRAASLGSGAAYYERRLIAESKIERLDLFELCPANLVRAKANVDIGGARIGFYDVDLNFAELPSSSYELIISRFFLHHIVNLEHLLYQVNRALTPDGIFILYDFVGESRYRWPAAKIQYVNRILERLKHLGVVGYRLGEHPGDLLTAPDRPDRFRVLIENSPFETIRSGDIISTLEAQFGESRLLEIRYGSLVHAAFRTLDFSTWDAPGLGAAISTFINSERDPAASAFRPCGLFGVYGKSSTRVKACPPWSERKIRYELEPGAATEFGNP